MFKNDRNVIKAHPMGDYTCGKKFYYRVPADTYHTQIFKKDTFFHEVSEGPFNRKDTVIANWAPNEKETALVKRYMHEISQSI